MIVTPTSVYYYMSNMAKLELKSITWKLTLKGKN